jgi:hypothetical protein
MPHSEANTEGFVFALVHSTSMPLSQAGIIAPPPQTPQRGIEGADPRSPQRWHLRYSLPEFSSSALCGFIACLSLYVLTPSPGAVTYCTEGCQPPRETSAGEASRGDHLRHHIGKTASSASLLHPPLPGADWRQALQLPSPGVIQVQATDNFSSFLSRVPTSPPAPDGLLTAKVNVVEPKGIVGRKFAYQVVL